MGSHRVTQQCKHQYNPIFPFLQFLLLDLSIYKQSVTIFVIWPFFEVVVLLKYSNQSLIVLCIFF